MSSNVTLSTITIQSQRLSQYLSLTFGLIILISGIIGNCINIIVFITFGHYKNNACSLYMLLGSFFDLLFLLLGLTTRILGQGFNMDFTLMNRGWCKMRSSLLDIISNCTLTCLCLQSIDVFFLTSRKVLIRQKSNVKIARFLLVGWVCIWIIYEIPYFIFEDLIFVNGIPTCKTVSDIYTSYHTYVSTLVLSICVPIVIIGVLAFRIYQHLQLLNTRERASLSVFARQMTRMALFQIGIVLLFQFPYGVATAYFVGTATLTKSLDRQLQDKLTQTFFNVYVYGLYAVSNNDEGDAIEIIFIQ